MRREKVRRFDIDVLVLDNCSGFNKVMEVSLRWLTRLRMIASCAVRVNQSARKARSAKATTSTLSTQSCARTAEAAPKCALSMLAFLRNGISTEKHKLDF